MLTSLSITNYALIDQLNITFKEGLSIITGETGAGKSILLGGLSLILGKRADLSAIKDSKKKCIIEGIFNIKDYNLKHFFEATELDYDDQSIIRREILPSGKSRAFINDTPVNLQILQELGVQLLDIHSQHQTLQLTDDSFQFQLIDALADNKSLLDNYRLDYLHLNGLKRELEALQIKKSELIKEYDYNSFLLNELNEYELEELDIVQLEDDANKLSNIETIQEKLGTVHQLLGAEGTGTIDSLNEVKSQLSRITDFGKGFSEIFTRIESLAIELDDIVAEIEESLENLEIDPSKLEEVNQKLSALNNLLHKHQVQNIDDLIVLKAHLETKVSDTEEIDIKISNINAKIEIVDTELKGQADLISSNRKKILPDLISQLEDILSKLGMPNSRFAITLSHSPDYLSNGMDRLNFKFSANKGGSFNDLKKAASGGELSRIMLAIKFIISKYVQLPTIMFDEIDTGVSGNISDKMASIMQKMSNNMQVFSITHLPQIAAKGDHHYKVYKKDTDAITSTYLKELNEEERIVEIAAMLSGSSLSDSAIAHAKQLLN